MFIYSAIDMSPTRVFKTSAALTGGAFTAVTLGENGVKTSAAGETPVGILVTESELPIAAGEDVGVQVIGGTLWQAGVAIKAGDLLAAGANGKAVKASGAAFAQALDSAAAGGTVHVLIIRS